MEHESCESAPGPILGHMPLWIRQPLMFKTRSVECILFVLSLLNKLFIKRYHVQWLYLFIVYSKTPTLARICCVKLWNDKQIIDCKG